MFGSLESDVTSFHGPLLSGSGGFRDILIWTHMTYRTSKGIALKFEYVEPALAIGGGINGGRRLERCSE